MDSGEPGEQGPGDAPDNVKEGDGDGREQEDSSHQPHYAEFSDEREAKSNEGVSTTADQELRIFSTASSSLAARSLTASSGGSIM